MINRAGHAGNPSGSTELVMQFTVQNGEAGDPAGAVGVALPSPADADGQRADPTKVLRAFEDDDPLSPTFNKRAIDGLGFDTPPTEFALVGSTEEWDLVNVFPASRPRGRHRPQHPPDSHSPARVPARSIASRSTRPTTRSSGRS